MMTRRDICYLCFVFAIAGCSSVAPVDSSGNSSGQEIKTGELEPRSGAVVLSRDQVSTETEAVKYLLDNAEQALRAEDFSRAQALADRALRIDRRTARAYLVSAYVQQHQGELSRAADLARQGLLYTAEDSTLGRRLRELLNK